MERLLTTEEIAEYLRVEVVTVRRLIARGELPAYRIGGEFRFIGPDVEAFVKSQCVTDSGENSFEKFTERSRRVLTFAIEEAQELGHNYIGTEHLLLGILREGEGIAAKMLICSGLDPQDVRAQVLKVVYPPDQQTSERARDHLKAFIAGVKKPGRANPYADPLAERNMTRRTKKVLELAVDEAQQMNHRYIGTEHLLLGILREGEGLAAQALIKGCGLQFDAVRTLTLQILQESATIPIPTIPAQAATLLGENEQGAQCRQCGANSPEYFRYCFHCGLKHQ